MGKRIAAKMADYAPPTVSIPRVNTLCPSVIADKVINRGRHHRESRKAGKQYGMINTKSGST